MEFLGYFWNNSTRHASRQISVPGWIFFFWAMRYISLEYSLVNRYIGSPRLHEIPAAYHQPR